MMIMADSNGAIPRYKLPITKGIILKSYRAEATGLYENCMHVHNNRTNKRMNVDFEIVVFRLFSNKIKQKNRKKINKVKL